MFPISRVQGGKRFYLVPPLFRRVQGVTNSVISSYLLKPGVSLPCCLINRIRFVAFGWWVFCPLCLQILCPFISSDSTAYGHLTDLFLCVSNSGLCGCAATCPQFIIVVRQALWSSRCSLTLQSEWSTLCIFWTRILLVHDRILIDMPTHPRLHR